jgi:hypothetical protein
MRNERIETDKFLFRPVVNGERLSGHGDETTGYPGIAVFEQPDGAGSLLFAIEAFHWADVAVHKGDEPDDETTELSFEGKVSVIISHGFVQYVQPKGTARAKR